MVRLDNKKWQIPDGPDDGSFEELLTYLQAQATQIKAQNANVERLLVFGINCAEGNLVSKGGVGSLCTCLRSRKEGESAS